MGEVSASSAPRNENCKMKIMKVRDFIYLDADRLKSIVAQTEEGLLTTISESTRGAKEGSTSAEGSVLSLIKAAGGVKLLWEDQATETRTLHDNIYNRVEQSLTDNDMLIEISEEDDSNFA